MHRAPMTRHSRLALALAVGAFFTLRPSRAAAQNVDHAYQTWVGVFTQGALAGRFIVHSDAHLRVYSDFSPFAVLVRPGVGYQLAPGMFATVGYAWTPSWPRPGMSFGDLVDEHRAWEQWQYEFPLASGALRLQLRTRLEQRWRPAAGDDTGLRVRQMVRVTVPLGGPQGRWLLALWDELFLGLNDTDWGQRGGLDQNRAFAGVGLWVAPGAARVEAGYFNQYVARRGALSDLSHHALMVNLYLTWR